MIAKLPMVKSGTFTVHLENDAGHHDPEPRPNRMHVTADRPPNVTLAKPPRHSSAAPGEKVALVLRAADDHGVGRARLEIRNIDAGADSAEASPPAPGEIDRLKEWTDLPGHEELAEAADRGRRLAEHRDTEVGLLEALRVALDPGHEPEEALVALAYTQAKKGFTIPGLGKLVVVARKARWGRNPATGEKIKIKAKKVLKFRIAKAAKDATL